MNRLFTSLLILLFWALPIRAEDFSGARVHHNGTRTIVNNTQTAVPFTAGSEEEDTDDYHDETTNTSRLSPGRAGCFELTAQVQFDANAVGLRTIQIRRNGTDIISYNSWEPEAATAIQIKPMASAFFCQTNPADYYELYVYQTSGGDLLLRSDSDQTWFSIYRMGTGVGGQVFDGYDAAGGAALGASPSWTDIPWDTERQKDSNYTHTASSAEVTIGESGRYKITYRVTGNQISSASALNTRLMVDTGSGFGEVPGTRSSQAATAVGADLTTVGMALLDVTSGDIIKVQGQSNAGGSTDLVADGSSLIIELIDTP